jgi:hypothetical protein
MNHDVYVPVTAPQLFLRDSSDERLLDCIVNIIGKGKL